MNRRIIANIIGRGWTVFAYLVTVPFYLHYLGVEAFAVMSLYVSLVSLSNVLDLGLSSTISRELARLRSDKEEVSDYASTLVGTLETLYAAAGGLVAAGTFCVAYAVSSTWHTGSSPLRGHLLIACILISLNVVAQWPVSFYSGALSGQGRQIELNTILVATATAQGIVGVLALSFASSKLVWFFSSQLAVGILRAFALRAYAWKKIPGHWHFDLEAIRQVFSFAGQMSFVGILAIMLTQSDKLIVGSQVGALNFAYYGLAATVAGGLSYLSLPVYDVAVPALTTSRSHSAESLRVSFWATSRNLSLAVLPVGGALVVLSRPTLAAWTGRATGPNTGLLLSLLAAGTVLNGLFYGPYALQVATGKARPLVVMNAAAALVYIPALVLLVHLFGATGAAVMWLSLNAGYLVVAGPLLLRRSLPGTTVRWLARFAAVPALCAVASVAVVRGLSPATTGRVASTVVVLVGVAAALLATVYSMPGPKRVGAA